MRAIALLCLLHVAFGQGQYSWNGAAEDGEVSDQGNVCLLDQASCGCCLMQRQLQRMEQFFNLTHGFMAEEMDEAVTTLSRIRDNRSAFSAALNNEVNLDCYGPFTSDRLVVYKHIFINLGGGYDLDTGVFTVTTSGVYSLSVTVYAVRIGTNLATCAVLQVNGREVSGLLEQNSQDFEDSATIVMAVKLMAGDQVAVNMPAQCFICDGRGHFNTFTGFLLYATK